MKQLLFLLLFPCLCLAQYTGNAGQKITLGEQTTADGLVFRGVLNDTALITPFSDTSAYIILDTVNNRFYNYNRATNVWSLAGGGVSVSSFSAGTTGLTPSTATTGAVTLGGTLAVANGGTGSATQNFVDLTTTQNSIAGAKTFTSTVTGARFDPTSSSVNGTGMYLPSSNALGLSSNNVQRMHITSGGSIGFGAIPSAGHDFQVSNIGSDEIVLFVINNIKDNPTTNTISRFDLGVYSNTANYIPSNTIVGQTNYIGQANDASYVAGKIDVTVTNAGNVGRAAGHSGIMRFYTKPTNDNGASERMKINEIGEVTINNLAGTGNRTVLADANGVLSAPVSSIITKENVQVLNYGLNEILKINPVSFDYINKNKWGDERNLGFIIEDMYPVVPEVTGIMNNGDMYLDMTKLIPILTKAIQEQNALIKALEQRILILENK